ncbi:MAG TPA: MFS transporter [Terriglobia bacterium]|nr:MFS transporter [Terriglobia bacterium]
MNAATVPPTPGLTTPRRTARCLVLMLMIVASVGYLCRVDITVVAPRLMAELHLSQPEMGKVFSAFLLGYTLFQIPSGWLAGRMTTRALFLALAVGWSALTFASALVGGPLFGMVLGALPVLLVLRFVLGIVAAPTYPAAGRAISLSVPPAMQGRANGLVLGSIGIGSAVAPPLLGFVTVRWGWRPALVGAALLAAVAAVAWRLIVPSPQTLTAARPQPARPLARDHTSPLRRPSFWFLTASYTLQGYVGYVFVFWFFLYLVQVRKFELLQAAWLTTLPWILSLIVIPLGGVVSDWAVKRWGSTWGRRSVPVPALALAAGSLLLGAHTRSAILAAASLTISTALVLVTEGPYWAAMTQISGPHSGTGGGVMNFGCNLGGMMSPVITPWLAARVGWEMALALAAALAIVGALLWLGINIDPAEEKPATPQSIPSGILITEN